MDGQAAVWMANEPS